MKKDSTQNFLEFDQIRNGIIVLKNKGLRMVLMTSSLNFALKSVEEQDAILYQFQNFLNSLDFSCQIIVQSRRLNITGYIDNLNKLRKKEKNELLQIQIEEYTKFINDIIGSGSIMQKTFYVVIPFSLSEIGAIQGVKEIVGSPVLSEEAFKRASVQLIQRVEFTSLGLKSCGINSTPLNTSEIIELFWELHHQKEAEHGYFPQIPPELTK